MELEFQITLAVIVAIIIGLVAVLKKLGLQSKYAPLTAVVLGVLATISLSFFEVTSTVVFTGIAIGLSACGLFDLGAKAKEIVS